MSDDPRPPAARTVRLPFSFGERVYLVGRTERIPGTVIGFIVHPRDVLTEVRWADSLEVTPHYQFELSSEYEFQEP